MSAVNKLIMIFAKALAAVIIAGIVLGLLSLAGVLPSNEGSKDIGDETGGTDMLFTASPVEY